MQMSKAILFVPLAVFVLSPVALAAEKEAPAPTFRNHIIPMMTKIGCNSGACHGALAGKGGMKLSLRGYDPDSDFFVLTRQALARRVDLTNPTDSLMLKKPLKALPHGGGTRFDDTSPHYAVLFDWIKAGAPGPKDA